MGALTLSNSGARLTSAVQPAGGWPYGGGPGNPRGLYHPTLNPTGLGNPMTGGGGGGGFPTGPSPTSAQPMGGMPAGSPQPGNSFAPNPTTYFSPGPALGDPLGPTPTQMSGNANPNVSNHPWGGQQPGNTQGLYDPIRNPGGLSNPMTGGPNVNPLAPQSIPGTGGPMGGWNPPHNGSSFAPNSFTGTQFSSVAQQPGSPLVPTQQPKRSRFANWQRRMNFLR